MKKRIRIFSSTKNIALGRKQKRKQNFRILSKKGNHKQMFVQSEYADHGIRVHCVESTGFLSSRTGRVWIFLLLFVCYNQAIRSCEILLLWVGVGVSSSAHGLLPILNTFPMVSKKFLSQEVICQGWQKHVSVARTQSPPGPLETSAHLLPSGPHVTTHWSPTRVIFYIQLWSVLHLSPLAEDTHFPFIFW